jgi:hypothetical protein
MSGPAGRPRSAGAAIALGVIKLARGQADGFRLFNATPEAFLASLAPLVAFPLVGGVLMLAGGGGSRALVNLLATLCAVLAPPVISHLLAGLWGRRAQWLRFAIAFNWCQWILPVVGMVVIILLGVAAALGLSEEIAGNIALLTIAGYGLWLHWFLARHGLSLSRFRAVLMVLIVNSATVAIVLGPRLLAVSAGQALLERT